MFIIFGEGDESMRTGFVLLIATFFVVCLWGCSGGQLESITQPDNPNTAAAPMDEPAQRILFGIWDIDFDPISEFVSVIPSRNIEAHFNVTNYVTPPQCDDCLGITIEGFNPDGWVYDIKVTLENPTPLTAYDVRGTLLIGAEGDNREIINVDDYTELFDDTTPPDRNPFKVFATDQPGRVYMPDAIHEVLYQISIPPPPIFNVKYVIDGSWPNNQKDPYEIYNQEITGELFDNGSGTADIVAYVKDWQMDVEWVRLDITPLGAPGKIDLVHQAGIKWEGLITNEFLAPAGEYELWIEAKSEINALVLYDKIILSINNYENSPPVWDDTIGITDAVPGDESVTVHFGAATDPSPPVTYNVYYSDTSPIDFDTSEVIAGNTESPVLVDELTNDQEYFFAVRAQDDEGLEDENEITLPATPFCSSHGWGLHWGGYTIARAIAYDEQGYIYVTGEFHETADFNPDPNEEDIHTPDDIYGVFLCKFTPDGDYIWGFDWGRGSGLDVTVDNTGNIYVTGHFAGTVDFDPGPGVDEHQHDVGSLGGCFVSKFDGDGNYFWARTFGGTYNTVGLPEISYGVGVDDWGNVYVTGHYIDTVDFDPGEGVDSHTSNGSYDCFLTKFNGAGDFQWARTWGGTGGFYESTGCSTESGINLATDSLGNIYVAGLFFNKVDFDPDPVEAFEETAVTVYCGFVSKFDSSGDFQWVDVWGYTARGITVDCEDFICIAGRELNGPCIKKYNQSGGLLWEGTWHNICFCLDIGVDGSNNIFTTGYYFGTVDFDPDPVDQDVHTSGYSEDIFTSKFDSDGDFKWVRTWGGTTLAHGYGVAVAPAGEAYTTGAFIGYGFDMDPGPGVDYHDNSGGPNAFLIKVLEDGYW